MQGPSPNKPVTLQTVDIPHHTFAALSRHIIRAPASLTQFSSFHAPTWFILVTLQPAATSTLHASMFPSDDAMCSAVSPSLGLGPHVGHRVRWCGCGYGR